MHTIMSSASGSLSWVFGMSSDGGARRVALQQQAWPISLVPRCSMQVQSNRKTSTWLPRSLSIL
jgi:hypothetical protein